MTLVTHPFSKTSLPGGGSLDVFFTYDDVTLIVSEFSWNNPGPATGVTITVNGVSQHRPVPSGPGSSASSGITLLPPVKAGTGPRFPFTVSIAPD